MSRWDIGGLVYQMVHTTFMRRCVWAQVKKLNQNPTKILSQQWGNGEICNEQFRSTSLIKHVRETFSVGALS